MQMIAVIPLAILATTSRGPVWWQEIAGYRLEKWRRYDKTGNAVETLFLKDGKERVVTAIQDFRVTPLGRGDRIVARRLEPEGIPEIVLETWTGGAHGSCRYFVWALGRHPRCLLAYTKQDIADEHDFEFVHLNSRRNPEIRSWYDGFAYTVGASYWPDLPIVFCYENGRYRDRTTLYPALLKRAARNAWDELWETDFTKDPASWSGPAAPSINLVALGELMGHRAQAWKSLKKVLPSETYRWLQKRDSAIVRIVRERFQRYEYPESYDSRRIRFHLPVSDRDIVAFSGTLKTTTRRSPGSRFPSPARPRLRKVGPARWSRP